MRALFTAVLLVWANMVNGAFAQQPAGTQLDVAPTTLDLKPGVAGLVYVSNHGDRPVTVHIEAMDWRQDGNRDLRFLRLLVNNIDRRTAMGRLIVSELEDNFQGKMFETHIPRSTVFEQAEYTKTTVFGSHAATYGASAAHELRRVMVHGLLHLLGHSDKSEAKRKAELEKAGLLETVRRRGARPQIRINEIH